MGALKKKGFSLAFFQLEIMVTAPVVPKQPFNWQLGFSESQWWGIMDGLLVYDLVGGQCPPHPGLKTVAGHVFWPHGKSEFFIDVCYQEELSILSIFHRCVRLYVDL